MSFRLRNKLTDIRFNSFKTTFFWISNFASFPSSLRAKLQRLNVWNLNLSSSSFFPTQTICPKEAISSACVNILLPLSKGPPLHRKQFTNLKSDEISNIHFDARMKIKISTISCVDRYTKGFKDLHVASYNSSQRVHVTSWLLAA